MKSKFVNLFIALIKFNHDHEEKTSFRSWLPSSYVVLKQKHNNNALLVDTSNRIIYKNCLITNLMMGMTKETHVLTFLYVYTYFRKDFTFDAKCVELHM